MNRWESLIRRVRETGGLRFSGIKGELLDAMNELNSAWGSAKIEEGVYRQKGNRFRDLIIALIQSQCAAELKEHRVRGLTDLHTIDIVYPIMGDPAVAVEVKMLGTPAHLTQGGTYRPERGGAVDLDKRLKEVKYTPIDLKLRYSRTVIGQWDQWVKTAIPKFYSIWACYIGQRERNRLEGMVRRFTDLRTYYNDGVALFFYEKGPSGHYREITIPELKTFQIDNLIAELCRTLRK